MRGVTAEPVANVVAKAFLLTRLMRGVTQQRRRQHTRGRISTHTPHARRDWLTIERYYPGIISTHTPHARRDLCLCRSCRCCLRFLLTRLMRGVTDLRGF